jgi:hypothetical protein
MASIVIILAATVYKQVDKKRKAKKAAKTDKEALMHYSPDGSASNAAPPPPYETHSPQYAVSHTAAAPRKPSWPQSSSGDSDTEFLAPAPLNIVRRESSQSSEARLHYDSRSIYEESGDETEVANHSSQRIELEAPPIPPKSNARRSVVM